MLFIILFLFIGYGSLILYYWYGWKRIPLFNTGKEMAGVRISVVIPARNEEKNISQLLEALEKQTYPRELFEVIVVDDHSTDRTAAITAGFKNITLIRFQTDPINSYKKKAIETGIAAATGEWIVTTDADCLPPPQWLQVIAGFKEKTEAVFIAAPVVYFTPHSFLPVFQTLDFLVLQGITGASVHQHIHSMCNGANLAYEKKVFYEVGGFSGIDTIASGDDMLLMHKIWKRYPQQVHYLKSAEAIVSTSPMPTWRDFFNQRIRWASKAGKYDDKRIFAVLLLVYLFNLSFPTLLMASFFEIKYATWLAGLFVAKTVIEFPFVYSVASFFNRQRLMVWFILFQPVHILYTIFSGLLGQFGKYEWKGRRVR